MKTIFSIMNQLTDMDWGWWPMLMCRPGKHQNIDGIVLAKITPFFGTVIGLLGAAIKHQLHNPTEIAKLVAISWIIFFVGYRLTFAVAWNYRAMQIRAEQGSEGTSSR